MKCICFIAFISGLFLSGCNDTIGIIELKGKVLDENTKVTVPNRRIFVQAMEKSGRTFVYRNAGEFYTDSSGCFAYRLKKVKNFCLYNFYVVGDSTYAFSNNKLGLTELKRDGKFLSLYVSKLVDFTIKINRISKTPFRDTLCVSWKSDGYYDETLYPFIIENHTINTNNSLLWIGGDINSTIKTKVFADKMTIVYWKLYRNGQFKEIIDTIFCKRDVVQRVCFTY